MTPNENENNFLENNFKLFLFFYDFLKMQNF